MGQDFRVENIEWSLTNDSALIVLIGVELALHIWSIQVVVGLLNHIMAVGDLALLKSALEDVDVGVVLQIHIANLTNNSNQ